MTSVRFRTGTIALELSGSEAFVDRQLHLLSRYLGRVDLTALSEADVPAPVPEGGASPVEGDAAELVAEAVALEVSVERDVPGAEPEAAKPADEVTRFYHSFEPSGSDPQADAALLFAYYLQRKEGMRSLGLGDLIRCCNRAGVDTRNFNRTVGMLTRRGFLETVRHGRAYRLSEQGAAVVENRM